MVTEGIEPPPPGPNTKIRSNNSTATNVDSSALHSDRVSCKITLRIIYDEYRNTTIILSDIIQPQYLYNTFVEL
jgi:hypothetical protein